MSVSSDELERWRDELRRILDVLPPILVRNRSIPSDEREKYELAVKDLERLHDQIFERHVDDVRAEVRAWATD